MDVTLEELHDIRERLNEINRTPLSDIRWFKDGAQIRVSDEDIACWEEIGLNNADFPSTMEIDVPDEPQ